MGDRVDDGERDAQILRREAPRGGSRGLMPEQINEDHRQHRKQDAPESFEKQLQPARKEADEGVDPDHAGAQRSGQRSEHGDEKKVGGHFDGAGKQKIDAA